MNLDEILLTLTSPFGVSGFENNARDELSSLLRPYCEKVLKDKRGNVFAFIPSGKKNAKKLMIDAHIDEVGLIIKGIHENGFLTFEKVGGIDNKILPSSVVTIYGKEIIKGVIGAKPPHLQTDDEDKSLKISDMAIDTGLIDASKIVSVGDVAVIDEPYINLLGDRVSGRCFDDRIGAAILLLLAKRIKKTKYDICLCATVGEEIGLKGAFCAAYGFNPDYSVSIDVTFGKSYNSSKNSFEIGCGPVLCISPSLDEDFTNHIRKTAEDENIKIGYETEGGNTGTNAWAVSLSAPDSRCALLSIPIRYMHSSVETADKKDIESATKLLELLISKGGF